MLGPPSAYAMTPEEVESAVNKQYSNIHRLAPHLTQGDRWDPKWEGFRDYGPMSSPQTMATAMARLRDLLERANPDFFKNVEKIKLSLGDDSQWNSRNKTLRVGMSEDMYDSPLLRRRWKSTPEFIETLMHEGVHPYGDTPKVGIPSGRTLSGGTYERPWDYRTHKEFLSGSGAAIPQQEKLMSNIQPEFAKPYLNHFRKRKEVLPNITGWAFAKLLYPGAEVPKRFPEGYGPAANEFLENLKLLDAFDKWKGK